MKKLLLCFMSLFMGFSLFGCSSDEQDALERIKEQGYITLGTSPDYAPNEFYIDDNGTRKIVGYDISLAQAIADEIGVELRIQESDFNTVIANAQAGEIDMGISGFAWTRSRENAVDFSVSYARDSEESSYQGIMIRREDIDKYISLESFRELGAVVGAQGSSIQYEMAQTIVDDENIIQLSDTTSVAAQLSTGDLDAFVCTSTQAYALMQTYTNIVLLPQDGFDMDPDGLYNQTGVIFSKDPSFDSLQEVVNEVITASLEKNEDGKSQMDIWYEEAVALMPFDLTEVIQAEQSEGE